MEVAGIVALGYVSGMATTFVVGYFFVEPRYNTYRSSELGQGFADVATFLYMVAFSVAWPVSVPWFIGSAVAEKCRGDPTRAGSVTKKPDVLQDTNSTSAEEQANESENNTANRN